MKIGKRHENMILALCTLFLTVLGLLMIYSATNVMAGSSARYGFDPAYFFKRQILFLVVGVSLAVDVAVAVAREERHRVALHLGERDSVTRQLVRVEQPADPSHPLIRQDDLADTWRPDV